MAKVSVKKVSQQKEMSGFLSIKPIVTSVVPFLLYTRTLGNVLSSTELCPLSGTHVPTPLGESWLHAEECGTRDSRHDLVVI